MFLINKTPETTKAYSRLVYGDVLANIAFISFENPVFIHSFKRDGENYNFQYMADFEFIDYLSVLTHHKYKHQKNIIICIDDFPEEVKGLLRINSDVVNAFKTVFEDLQLDHLVKESI